MGRGGGRSGGFRGGFSGRSSSFGRGFSGRSSSAVRRSSSAFSGFGSSAFTGNRRRGGGAMPTLGTPRTSIGSSLWPFLLFGGRRNTVVINNYGNEGRGTPGDLYKREDIPSAGMPQATDCSSPASMPETASASGAAPANGPVSSTGDVHATGSASASDPEGGGNADRPRYPSWFPAALVFSIIAVIGLLIFAAGRLMPSDTEPRERISSELCTKTSYWYDDSLGWIYDEDELLSGMEYFYDETGIQPYLMIRGEIFGSGFDISETEARLFLEESYEQLFDDEGHMILCFVEYSPSEYLTFIYTGATAASVMDEEARELMLDNVDRLYYDTELSDEEFFSQVFSDTAEELMDSGSESRAPGYIALFAAAFIAIAMALLYLRLKKNAEYEVRKARVKEILSTPIGADPAEDELKRKYLGSEAASKDEDTKENIKTEQEV